MPRLSARLQTYPLTSSLVPIARFLKEKNTTTPEHATRVANTEAETARFGMEAELAARLDMVGAEVDLPLPLLFLNRRPHPLLLCPDLLASLFFSCTNGPPPSPNP